MLVLGIGLGPTYATPFPVSPERAQRVTRTCSLIPLVQCPTRVLLSRVNVDAEPCLTVSCAAFLSVRLQAAPPIALAPFDIQRRFDNIA